MKTENLHVPLVCAATVYVDDDAAHSAVNLPTFITRFEGADLRRANLMGADLRGAALEGALLAGAIYSDQTRWPPRFEIPEEAIRIAPSIWHAHAKLYRPPTAADPSQRASRSPRSSRWSSSLPARSRTSPRR